MLALIVCAGPCEGFDVGWLVGLASDADLLIAADGGAQRCAQAGLLPDVVVGDLDSLSQDTESQLRSDGAVVESVSADKDVSDLDIALEAARLRGATAVTVSCATGGRLDHLLAVVGSLAAAVDLRPAIVDPQVTAWLMNPAHRSEVVFDSPDLRVSLFGLESHVRVSASGMRWPLHDSDIGMLSSLGLSNLTIEPKAVVRVLHGTAVAVADSRP